MIGTILANVIGRGAIKAIAGGAASAVTATGAMAMGACDLETMGQQIGAAAGAFVVGHVVTWLSPANR